MFQCLISIDSEFWSFLEHSFEKVESISIETVVFCFFEVKIASSVLGQNITVSCAFKNRFVEKQVMENDSGRKDVTDGLAFERHVLNVDDFGSHKARSSTPDKKILFLIGVGSKPEITDGNFQ